MDVGKKREGCNTDADCLGYSKCYGPSCVVRGKKVPGSEQYSDKVRWKVDHFDKGVDKSCYGYTCNPKLAKGLKDRFIYRTNE